MQIDSKKRLKGEVAPDIVVIGAMRAGTTTMYELMRRTNVVSVPKMKETDFFTAKKFSRGLGWLNGQYSDLKKPIVDVSPNYTKVFVIPGVAKRIYETNPDTKLIYILRDPVKRAISEFHHMAAMGYDIPMPDKVGAALGKSVTDCSLYYAQLKPYLEYWDINDIEIIEFEDLIHDQWGTIAALYTRLGLPEFSIDEETVHTNSSDQLQNVPQWWGQLRNKPFFEWLRSVTPRETVDFVKSSLLTRTANDNTQKVQFEQSTIDVIRRDVADDVRALRELTGRSFSRWEI